MCAFTVCKRIYHIVITDIIWELTRPPLSGYKELQVNYRCDHVGWIPRWAYVRETSSADGRSVVFLRNTGLSQTLMNNHIDNRRIFFKRFWSQLKWAPAMFVNCPLFCSKTGEWKQLRTILGDIGTSMLYYNTLSPFRNDCTTCRFKEETNDTENCTSAFFGMNA